MHLSCTRLLHIRSPQTVTSCFLPSRIQALKKTLEILWVHLECDHLKKYFPHVAELQDIPWCFGPLKEPQAWMMHIYRTRPMLCRGWCMTVSGRERHTSKGRETDPSPKVNLRLLQTRTTAALAWETEASVRFQRIWLVHLLLLKLVLSCVERTPCLLCFHCCAQFRPLGLLIWLLGLLILNFLLQGTHSL